jgi:ABC-type proline/glycine betaine transport system permease subunit
VALAAGALPAAALALVVHVLFELVEGRLRRKARAAPSVPGT